LLPYTRLNQPPALEHAAPAGVLQALLPLLGMLGPVTLEAEPVGLVLLPRPALDQALLAWVLLAAAESPRGTALRIGLRPVGAGVALRLWPNPAGAADGLVAVAALAGGSTNLGADMAELLLPYAEG
jgi:hypothetical protein